MGLAVGSDAKRTFSTLLCCGAVAVGTRWPWWSGPGEKRIVFEALACCAAVGRGGGRGGGGAGTRFSASGSKEAKSESRAKRTSDCERKNAVGDVLGGGGGFPGEMGAVVGVVAIVTVDGRCGFWGWS